MIKVVAIDPELFADGLIRNYGAYRTWLQFFLLHMMHGFTIVVPKGKKAGFEEAALAAKDHFHRSAQGQIERYLPERIHEVNIQDAWRDDVKVCQLCRDDADAFDMLALAAGGVVDVLVARSTFSAKCANIPKWVKDKVLPWNKYPGKKYWPDLASSMGARHITDAADSDELIERLLRHARFGHVCDPYICKALLQYRFQDKRGNWNDFKITLGKVSGCLEEKPLVIKSAPPRDMELADDVRRLDAGLVQVHPGRAEWRCRELAEWMHAQLKTELPRARIEVELFSGEHDRFLVTQCWALQMSRGFDFDRGRKGYKDWTASLMPQNESEAARVWANPPIAVARNKSQEISGGVSV